jgi:prepilin-type processing-associated H-X9-DG protein
VKHSTGKANTLAILAFASVLIALALPVLSRQREQANRARCLDNLHSIWQAMRVYAYDSHGWLPAMSQLERNGTRGPGEIGFNRHANLLLGLGYTTDPSIFVCPSDKEDGDPSKPLGDDGSTGHARVRVRKPPLDWYNISYFYVAGFTLADRGDFLLLADEHWDSEGDCPADCRHDLDQFDNHGKSGRNVLYLDGHGEWLNGPQIDPAYESIRKYGANFRTRTVD